MKKFLILSQIILCAFSSLAAHTSLLDEKIYVQNESCDFRQDNEGYYIRTKKRDEWIRSSEMHRDCKGFFTYLSKVDKEQDSAGTPIRYWQCPYCDKWWPKGFDCGNSNCPRYVHDDWNAIVEF